MNSSSQQGQTEFPLTSPTTTRNNESLSTNSTRPTQSLGSATVGEVDQPTDLTSSPFSTSSTLSLPGEKSNAAFSLPVGHAPLHGREARAPCCLGFSEPLLPSMTTQSLSELDVKAIFHNPKLRHDINYDPYLHFRPNTDGPKGDAKRRHADAYWQMLTGTLLLFQSRGGCSSCRLPTKIMVTMFRNLQGILVTLLPPADQLTVLECIDATRILQELSHHVFRPGKLLKWLGSLLKLHCAPMRDEEVNTMIASALKADQEDDMALLAQTLRHLFDILEMMKLDVANHQIRSYRPSLVAGTLEFHTEYYSRRIQDRRLNPHMAKVWYERARDIRPDPEENHMVTFIKALTLVIAPSTETTEIPATFECDVDRLDTSRLEIRELTCLRICQYLFSDLRRKVAAPKSLDPQSMEDLLDDIQDVLGDDDKQLRWLQAHEQIALLLVQRALSLAGRTLQQTPADQNLIEFTTLFLKNNLQSQTRFYITVEETVLRTLQKQAVELASTWTTPLSMAELQPRKNLVGRRATAIFTRDMAVVARRIAHVSWLHWKVFAPLVYMVGEPGYEI